MKFKIGQKIRIKQWLNVPEELTAEWGKNYYAGHIGVIESENGTAGVEAYDVKPDGNKTSVFCLKEELEPLIKVGEQLLLFEL